MIMTRRSLLLMVGCLVHMPLNGMTSQSKVAGCMTESISGAEKSSLTLNGSRITYEGKLANEILTAQISALAFDLSRIMGFKENEYPVCLFLSSPNEQAAFAYSGSIDGFADTKGAVLIGRGLIDTELDKGMTKWKAAAIAGIIAHEFSHIFQYRSKATRKDTYYDVLRVADDSKIKTKRVVELHADFLAGWYLGLRTAVVKEGLTDFARTLFSKGDRELQDVQHHGTPEQRVLVMNLGYSLATEGKITDVSSAARMGLDQIRQFLKIT